MSKIKNILLATDFSENSVKACEFGIEIARKTNAKVFLLHVFSMPIINSETPEFYDYNLYHSIKTKSLEKLTAKLNLKDLKYETVCISGISFTSEIESFVEKHQIDLLTLGLTGTSAINELFMGSNTLYLVSNSKIPLVAVPVEFNYRQNLKVGLAFDNQAVKKNNNLAIFREISKLFSEKINAFHVNKKDNNLEVFNNLKELIPFNEFDLKIEINSDTNNGILEYITNEKIELLGIIPKKHKFFDRLFNESYTKEYTRYSKIPIITIPQLD
jgi:nucleotide-binding universal stress UspA family protein